MEVLSIVLIIGIIPAMIASSKGRSFFLWYIYGVCFFIIALVHSILISKNSELVSAELSYGKKKCPQCAEWIQADALVCRYCQKVQPKSIDGCPICGNPNVYYDVYNKRFCSICGKHV